MPTVSFEVPKDVADAFSEAFSGENENAIIAGLMRAAVEERRFQKRRADAIEELLNLRRTAESVSFEECRRARHWGRP